MEEAIKYIDELHQSLTLKLQARGKYEPFAHAILFLTITVAISTRGNKTACKKILLAVSVGSAAESCIHRRAITREFKLSLRADVYLPLSMFVMV